MSRSPDIAVGDREVNQLTMIAYREVCSGRTGHAEAVHLTYQTGSVGYGELVEFFYRTHDPTTVDRQGPDRGSRKFIEHCYVYFQLMR